MLIVSNYEYKQITDKERLLEFFVNGRLYELYDLCFGVEPYYEDLTPDEVYDIFEKYRLNGLLYVCLVGSNLVGFSAVMPLSYENVVYEIIKKYRDNADDYWYHADVGIHPDHQRKGIATTLLKCILDKAPAQYFVMRTNEKNKKSIGLHEKFYFRKLMCSDGTPDTHDVYRHRKNRKIEPDIRICMTLEK